jgi:mRNA interferase RelE/StbE
MYKVRFTSAALGQLENLDKPISRQVFKKLKWLAEHLNEATPIPLTGNLKDIYRLRVGDYRALYTFDKSREVIVVHFVQHRSEVYKPK